MFTVTFVMEGNKSLQINRVSDTSVSHIWPNILETSDVTLSEEHCVMVKEFTKKTIDEMPSQTQQRVIHYNREQRNKIWSNMTDEQKVRHHVEDWRIQIGARVSIVEKSKFA